MGITREIPAGEPFELAGRIVGLERETGRAVLVERNSSTWRIGSTDPPAFHAANAAMMCSIEFGSATTTSSPSTTPRSAKRCAICVARRSSSVQVAAVSVPSRRARMMAGSSPYSL